MDQFAKAYHEVINYDEVEHKLSNQFSSTIRNNNRLKYNYLSQHYLDVDIEPLVEPPHFCDASFKGRKNILELADCQLDKNQNKAME